MVFVDASYWIALFDPKDAWHEAARASLPALRKRKAWRTHALAIGEVVAVIGPRRGGKAARVAYEGALDASELLLPTASDLDGAMLDVLRHDGELSLSDALFVHYGRALGESEVLSFDSGFDRTSLRRLPSRP